MEQEVLGKIIAGKLARLKDTTSEEKDILPLQRNHWIILLHGNGCFNAIVFVSCDPNFVDNLFFS